MTVAAERPLLTREELVRERFVPTVVYVRETPEFHTRLCIYNYFSEIFPDVKTGATARLWFFDKHGEFVDQREVYLPYRGQLQFEVAELGREFEGTAGVALVPDTVPEFKHKGVGTGYYVYYYDNQGHADFSHEWEAMHFSRFESQLWICGVRPSRFPTELILMSGYYGTDPAEGTADWWLRVRGKRGQVLAERKMPPLPPRACLRFRLEEYVPNVEELARREGTLGVQINGANIQGPFTWVTGPGGDFNIHHFC